jgi:hypothetical protein
MQAWPDEKCTVQNLCAEPVGRQSGVVRWARPPPKTPGDAALAACAEKTAQGAVLRCKRQGQKQRRSNPQTRFMGKSEFAFRETLVPASTVERMMGPSKANVADTPRLAACRTTVAPAFERAWSPLSVPDRFMPPTLHRFMPRRLCTPVQKLVWGSVEDGHAPTLLTHAPLQH